MKNGANQLHHLMNARKLTLHIPHYPTPIELRTARHFEYLATTKISNNQSHSEAALEGSDALKASLTVPGGPRSRAI